MNYWFDAFTGRTWDEFRKAGASISGFNERFRKQVGKLKPGDMLLCYLTGVMRWVGALEVLGTSDDQKKIWSESGFPVRVTVKPLTLLEAEHGVPMAQLEGKTSFFRGPQDAGKFRGIVRKSPALIQPHDGAIILDLLRESQRLPVSRPVDQRKLYRKLFTATRRKGKAEEAVQVSVPEEVEDTPVAQTGVDEKPTADEASEHTRTQHLLLTLGREMGFDVWVARNDRGRICAGAMLGNLPGMLEELPTQFNDATTRTIELIDVLWLKGSSIEAAFEVECTTSIYSGLLRISDLLALQPNLSIKLYLVAPAQRRSKVDREIMRPTFRLRDTPLGTACGYLELEELTEKVERVRELGIVQSLKASFLEDLAEHFGEDADAG
jgi:hypothetical protein